MQRALMVLVMLWTGCASTGVSRGALVTSTAALACDWKQTRDAAERGWTTTYESNPMLGPRPTTGAVDIYFASGIAINAALWYLLPRRYRAILPAIIIGVQTYSITNNVERNLGACGVHG